MTVTGIRLECERRGCLACGGEVETLESTIAYLGPTPRDHAQSTLRFICMRCGNRSRLSDYEASQQ